MLIGLSVLCYDYAAYNFVCDGPKSYSTSMLEREWHNSIGSMLLEC